MAVNSSTSSSPFSNTSFLVFLLILNGGVIFILVSLVTLSIFGSFFVVFTLIGLKWGFSL